MIPPDFSVVIPTFNRVKILEVCLDHLENLNDVENGFEVVVCDDGSSDDTMGLLKQKEKEFFFHLVVLSQKNSGPGEARNTALNYARGNYVLFLNDDTLAAPDLLEKHLAFHKDLPGDDNAVVGLFSLPKNYNATSLGVVLDKTCVLFGYPKLTHGKICGYEHFYTCNLSIPKRLLKNIRFDPVFKAAAAEDIDLGYRLEKDGVRIYYSEECRSVHEHRITLTEFCRINEVRGYWAGLFFSKYDDLTKKPDLCEEAFCSLRKKIFAEKIHAKRVLHTLLDTEKEENFECLDDETPASFLKHVEFLRSHYYEKGLLTSPYLSRIIQR